MSLKQALKSLAMMPDLKLEDSDDFSEDEAQRATFTTGPDDLVQWLLKNVRGSRVAKYTVQEHHLRRWRDHLYYRARLVAQQEPDRVLIFRVDWVKDNELR
jgi:hypothetical protein